MHEKIEKWREWIRIIEEEVRGLRIQNHIFHEVQAMIAANQELHKPSTYYDWMTASHASASSIGIRRQADESRDIVSLTRLLREVEADDRLLQRDWFLSLYEDSAVPERIAGREFDRLAGEGSDFYAGSLAKMDRVKLQDAAATIKDYVNRRVAHRGRDDPAEVPTFHDLDEVLDLLESLLLKYKFLLWAEEEADLLPTWQYDWKAIFRTRWIPEEVSNPHESESES